jgi:hypothetical protein
MRRALVSRYEARLAGTLGGLEGGAPAFGLLASLGDLVDGHLFIAPYVAIHAYFGRENVKARVLGREIFPGVPEPVRVGVFLDETAVARDALYRDLRGLVAGDDRVRLVRCGAEDGVDGARSLRAVARLPHPFEEGVTLGVPSLLDVLDHVAGEGYTVLHAAAPGPLGIAALVAGLVLGVPVVGAYRAGYPERQDGLSQDAMVSDLLGVALREFYGRCSAVAVPSAATILDLKDRGYRVRRYEVLSGAEDFLSLHAAVAQPGTPEGTQSAGDGFTAAVLR